VSQALHGKRTATHLSWSALDLLADRPLPGKLYLCIRHRLVCYRNKGDVLTQKEYDRLIYNRVEAVFIEKESLEDYTAWLKGYEAEERKQVLDSAAGEQKPILQSTLELRRAALDLFGSPHVPEALKGTLDTSKRMVTEFLKKPYIIENIAHLQRYGRGCVDHSVNVSVLSVFLGVQLGYTSQLILENLALGGLMHDLGKAFLPPRNDEKLLDETDPEYRRHPIYGAEALDKMRLIPQEVKMVVEQHHEYADGTGYPKGLQGLAIYELTRIVAIANVFDNLVSEGTGDIYERQKQALTALGANYGSRLDRKKLEKAIKIIEKSLAIPPTAQAS
jgi:putative nucleotidyltransferase with HDIG domain